MHGALADLNRLAGMRAGDWLVGNQMTQADVTAGCVVSFLSDALGVGRGGARYPNLTALSERCEALPAFRAVKAEFLAPDRTS